MKKILIALALVLSVQIADAQVKTAEQAKSAISDAEAAAQNAKKATKVATWLKLAEAYVNAYNVPSGNVWVGASKQELQLMMGNEKPTSQEEVQLGGEVYLKETYAAKDLYFTQNGQLAMVVVTKPVLEEDALAAALEAYKKAYEVDVKKSKEKDIKAGIELIAKKYVDEGMNSYMLADMAAATNYFEKAAEASATEPYAVQDTVALYNAGYTALAVQDYQRAKKFFEKCLEIGYYYEGGEVYAKLAETYNGLGDKAKGVEFLEEGFAKFPQSQSILIGLINYYIESGDKADRLFVLIDEAKKNEPDNASLYYVEGNIYKELGQEDKAYEAYMKCESINPAYEYGFIGAGIMFYDKAVELSKKASEELDDAKYMALVEEFENCLLKAIEPFEKAYATTADNTLKVSVAEYLKNIYYRFITKGPEYEEGYKKYDAIVASGKAQ